MNRPLTPLEATVLCLIARAPLTGGEVLALLRQYPIMGRGQSPGAIYPALRRLYRAGLIKRRDRCRPRLDAGRWYRFWPEEREGGRVGGDEAPGEPRDRWSGERGPTKEYALTDEGLGRLQDWSKRPVTRADLLERPDDLLLRFCFLRGLRGLGGSDVFLRQYEAASAELCEELKEALERERETLSTSTRLALELTLLLLRTRRDWARRAAREVA